MLHWRTKRTLVQGDKLTTTTPGAGRVITGHLPSQSGIKFLNKIPEEIKRIPIQKPIWNLTSTLFSDKIALIGWQICDEPLILYVIKIQNWFKLLQKYIIDCVLHVIHFDVCNSMHIIQTAINIIKTNGWTNENVMRLFMGFITTKWFR